MLEKVIFLMVAPIDSWILIPFNRVSRITQLEILTFSILSIASGPKRIAAHLELIRQLVTTTSVHGKPFSLTLNAILSSSVLKLQLAISTSLQPSRSIPSRFGLIG